MSTPNLVPRGDKTGSLGTTSKKWDGIYAYSLNVASITASLEGTASYAVTASYAISASHEIIKEISSSYADTASFAQSGYGIFSGSFSGSLEGDGSGITGVTAEWDGSHIGDASITGSFYVSGSSPTEVKFGNTFIWSNPSGSIQFTGSFSNTGSFNNTGTFINSGSIIISGSLNVSGGITTTASGIYSGSFSGSFEGDGSGLTDITAETSQTASYVDYINIDNKPTLVSGSSQISYTGITDIPLGILSSSAQIATDISGAFTSDSASFSTRISTNETDISTLTSNTGSYVLTSQTSSMTVLSSSYAITASYALNALSPFTAAGISGSWQGQNFISASQVIPNFPTGTVSGSSQISYTGITDVPIGILSSSAQISSEISGAFTADSASLAANIATNITNISSLTSVTSSYLVNSDTGSLGDTTINGDLVVNGTGSFNVLITNYQSSSIIYSSGSTKFGDTMDDTHVFTGSLFITGSEVEMDATSITFTGVGSSITTGAKIEIIADTDGIELQSNADYIDLKTKTRVSESLEVIGSLTTTQTSSAAFFVGDGSNVTGVISSSYAITASHALNAGGGGSPGGSNTQVQFNDGGSFGGDTGFTYNKTTDSVTIIGNITASGNISASNYDGTHIGVSSGTNTGDVTLDGTPDYITISGQTITRGTIDIGDDTNLAVSDTSGQTGIDMTLSGDTLSGTTSGLTTTSDVLFNNITASANISASGDIYGQNINANDLNLNLGRITPIGSATNIRIVSDLNVQGNITASANISSSGDIISTNFIGDGSSVTGVISASYAVTASHALNAGGGGGTPGGSDTQVQFNDGSSFGGDAGFTYNKTTDSVNILGNITASANISSSGTITGNTGSFSHLVGNSPITFGSPQISNLNGTSIIEVTASNQFPSPLAANTTYIIRGTVETSTALTVTNDNVAIRGMDRNKDKLVYTGTGPFITTTDVNFSLSDIQLKSSGSILSGSNIDLNDHTNNYQRLKVLEIRNCEIRNTNNVWKISGYELVDISNTLMWYITGSVGCHFESNRHLEMTSCEVFNWQDEETGTVYAPSGTSMIKLLPNLLDSGSNTIGTAVVNINSSIIHPIQSQSGFFIDTDSTTRFGTLGSNTFIDVGLNTAEGSLIAGSNYDSGSMLNYDIGLNQGILNSTSGVIMTVTGNTTNTALATATPIPINIDGLAINRASVRYTVSTDGRCTYIGGKTTYVSIHSTISYQKQGGGADSYIFYLYKNGVEMAGSEVNVLSGGGVNVASLTYGTLISESDYIEIYIENPDSGDDILITNAQLLIRE